MHSTIWLSALAFALDVGTLDASSLPTCSKGSRPEVCVGVHGVPSWATDDSNAKYKEFINRYDQTNAGSCGGYGSTIGQMDLWGGCTGNSNDHVASSDALHAASADFASVALASAKFQAVHKVWGSSTSYATGGVVKENIEIGVDDVLVAATGEKSLKQNVMLLNFRGDAYDGPVRGLERKGSTEKQCESGTACPKWDYTTDGKRTGAVLATQQSFGPGRYHVRAMIPRTSDTALKGRGYVFAMWTFHYEEIYKDSSHAVSDQYVSPDDYPGFQAGSAGDGYYTGHNHEIDIEIPANSPQVDWDTQLGWDTMNANTWIGDNGKYCDGCEVYYQQAQVNAQQTTSFISENGEYHDYDFEWSTNKDDPSKNTVTWYFDGREVFSTQKFVPTRAGHLLVGPWPAWWGTNKQNSTVETATVKIAEITITPQEGQALSFAQTYDQKFGTCDYACDFQPLVGTGPAPGPAPSPVPPTPSPGPTPPTPSPGESCEGATVKCPNGDTDCATWVSDHGCPSYTKYYCRTDNGYCHIKSQPPLVV